MKKDAKQKLFENMSKLNPDFNLNEGKNYNNSRIRMIALIEKELNIIREEARTDDTVFWYQTLLYSVLDKIRSENYRG